MPVNDAVNSCFHEINWKLDGVSLSENEKNTSFSWLLFENWAHFTAYVNWLNYTLSLILYNTITCLPDIINNIYIVERKSQQRFNES